MGDRRIPARVRQALNVESGLNDGLAVPFLAVALVMVGAVEEAGAGGDLALETLQLLGVGLLAGLAVGGGIGLATDALDWRTLAPAPRQVGVAAVPLLALGVATLLGGNGFIAAFVGGVAFGSVVDDAHELVEFGEDLGELLALSTFLVFGAVFVGPTLDVVDGATLLYVALSLTVVRMLPIAVSLVGLRLQPPTIGVLGWLGPRGLATVVFGLEVLELAEEGLYPTGEELFGVAALAVVASVLAHGLSAAPLASAYAGWVQAMAAEEDTMAEHVEVTELPMRGHR